MIATVLALVLAASACGKTEAPRPPPPLPPPGTATGPMLPPRPGDPPEPVSLTCDCATGPVPAPPGEQPIVSRQIAIAPDGTTTRTVRRLGGAVETAPVPLDPARLARLRDLARIALATAPHAEEPIVPDGTACTVQIGAGGATTLFRAPLPARSPLVGPLLEDLRPLLEL